MSGPSERESWSRLARIYDWQLWAERPALRALVELLRVRRSERLLDVATGTGALLRELAGLDEAPVEAVGVDRSPAMLAQAERHLQTGWRTVLGDAAALPFEAASFDIVTASYLLHLLDEDERTHVIAELRRVLIPGGRLGTITVAPPAGKLGAWLGRPLHAAAARSQGVLAGLRPLDPRRELERAGFRIRETRRINRALPSSLCVVAERLGEGF
jgi:demethylmenaquinone methyltransferase/2-methoxy-6-polyprenyl-1,4-benzoquinol methylase